MRLVGLEEHFVTAEVVDAWQGLESQWQDLALPASAGGETGRRLNEIGSERFAAMDDVGLDVQVLSLTTPGLQNLEVRDAVRLQAVTNDALADAVRESPDRLQGLAALATPSPNDAARELERAVKELGMNGAMLFGRTRERFLDHPDFWPIFEVAADLNAPLHLHPQSPPPEVRAAYYSGFSPGADAALASHRLGWHYETGVQLVRLIASGVFDRFPGLRVIVGHWGEMVLFYLERIELLGMFAGLPRPFSDYVRSNVLVAPGGIFSQRYLRWATEVVGAERILFSTDYPFESAPGGGARRFLEEADLSGADRARIASGNWEALCAGIRR